MHSTKKQFLEASNHGSKKKSVHCTRSVVTIDNMQRSVTGIETKLDLENSLRIPEMMMKIKIYKNSDAFIWMDNICSKDPRSFRNVSRNQLN
jgi:hypothetical protein